MLRSSSVAEMTVTPLPSNQYGEHCHAKVIERSRDDRYTAPLDSARGALPC
ncbi:MAG: hypothetical protein ACKOA1_08580 [Bacteroidota bacterium]